MQSLYYSYSNADNDKTLQILKYSMVNLTANEVLSDLWKC